MFVLFVLCLPHTARDSAMRRDFLVFKNRQIGYLENVTENLLIFQVLHSSTFHIC